MLRKKVISSFRDLIDALKVEGSFFRNLAISFSGNAVAQVLGFAFTPFIARIYGPEAYGIFALCMAVVSNLQPLSTLQFPAAFVAAKTDREFYDLVKLSIIFLSGTVLCTSLAVLFVSDDIIHRLHAEEIQGYLYIIPFYLFLMGIDSIFLGWSICLKEFKLSAWGRILSIVSSKTVTLAWGLLLEASATGMIIGNLLIYPIDNLVKLMGEIKSNVKNIFVNSSRSSIAATFKKFKGYPLYITPGLLISNLSIQLPVFYFSFYFLPADVGLFAMANSLVSTPLYIVISSSTAVFLQKAAETIQSNPAALGSITMALYKRLFLVGAIPLGILAFISTWLFRLLLGAEWEVAGIFASYLAIGAIFSVPTLPLSVLFRLLNYERANLLLNLGSVGLKLGALWVGVYQKDLVLSVIGYSFVSIVSFIFTLTFIFTRVNLPRKILLLHASIIVSLFAVVMVFRG